MSQMHIQECKNDDNTLIFKKDSNGLIKMPEIAALKIQLVQCFIRIPNFSMKTFPSFKYLNSLLPGSFPSDLFIRKERKEQNWKLT